MFLKNKSVTNYNREKIHRQLACNVSRIKDMKICFKITEILDFNVS